VEQNEESRHSHMCYFFETGSSYVTQAGLAQAILLPQFQECWGYRCVPRAWLSLSLLCLTFGFLLMASAPLAPVGTVPSPPSPAC
jgi:hypothetical protein